VDKATAAAAPNWCDPHCVAAGLQVRSGKGKKEGALDGIGKGGAMAAGGGGGSYDDYAGGSSRRMEFQSGRG
jgi:hypothetical protein